MLDRTGAPKEIKGLAPGRIQITHIDRFEPSSAVEFRNVYQYGVVEALQQSLCCPVVAQSQADSVFVVSSWIGRSVAKNSIPHAAKKEASGSRPTANPQPFRPRASIPVSSECPADGIPFPQLAMQEAIRAVSVETRRLLMKCLGPTTIPVSEEVLVPANHCMQGHGGWPNDNSDMMSRRWIIAGPTTRPMICFLSGSQIFS